MTTLRRCASSRVPVGHDGVGALLMALMLMQASGLDLTTSKLSSSASAALGCPSWQLDCRGTIRLLVTPLVPALIAFHVQLSPWCQMKRTHAQPA